MSKKAAERLLELGDPSMAAEIKMWEEHDMRISRDHYRTELPRHDARLVQVVEELGDEASGSCARLDILEIDGDRYIIDEYDGMESVVEPIDIDWVIVEK